MKTKEFENKNLICKLAWDFHKSTGVDYKELLSEAYLAYCEAINSYDENKGCKKTTWAWRIINNQLIDYTKREKCIPHYVSPLFLFGSMTKHMEYNIGASMDDIECALKHHNKLAEKLPEVLLTHQPTTFEELISDLSEECKQIAKVILSNVDAIPENIPPKMARGVVVKLLREEGYSWPYILRGMKGLRLAISG